MGNIYKGYTFSATELVTAELLHALVDDGSLGNIVANDISNGVITDAKINSVGGDKLINLNLTPSGAGVIPVANLTSVAQKGANSDITSLSGLTTLLSRAQGGLASNVANNAASGVVFLDANSKLPAVDGSQLTGINVLSNVIFCWSKGETTEAGVTTQSTSYLTFLLFKFKKIAGISTVTVQARLKSGFNTEPERTAFLKVSINTTLTGEVSRDGSAFAWVTSVDIDVSSLTNGTTYNGIVQILNEDGNGTTACSAVTLIAS